jgi:RelB Antitoxin
MLNVKKRFIVDENNRPVEVVLDVATFAKIEAALEDHLFGKLLRKAAKQKPLSLEKAKAMYARMKKRS